MANMIKSLSMVASLGLLSACVSFGGGKPPPFLLSLTPDTTLDAGAVRSGPKSGSVVVRLPTTPQKINTLRVPVQKNNTGIAYLKNAVWVEKPAQLSQDLLIAILAAKNNRLVLTSAHASAGAASLRSCTPGLILWLSTTVDAGYRRFSCT